MTSKKVLIYKKESSLKPVGGSSGYLYNLKIGLQREKIQDIDFLEEDEINKTTSNKTKVKNIWHKLPDQIRKKMINLLLIKSLYKKNVIASRVFSNYDIIHFHSTLALYLNRESLKKFKGKVLITSHSPKPWHKEVIEDNFSNMERKLYKFAYTKLESVDKYAFNRADFIIFPCEQAEEPYANNWDDYKEIKNHKGTSYRYIPSGIDSAKAKLNKKEVLQSYNIPYDSFIISYVGRHNETKGYDNLKEIGEYILNKYPKAYILVAGKEEPIKGIDHPRWIEVGWTNDPHSIINVADVFILPNKETYFDLILLEVLSLGKIVIASKTGGNKYFERFPSKSIFLYENKDEAIIKIEDVMTKSKSEIVDKGNINKDLFSENFTLKKFTNDYQDLINKL